MKIKSQRTPCHDLCETVCQRGTNPIPHFKSAQFSRWHLPHLRHRCSTWTRCRVTQQHTMSLEISFISPYHRLDLPLTFSRHLGFSSTSPSCLCASFSFFASALAFFASAFAACLRCISTISAEEIILASPWLITVLFAFWRTLLSSFCLSKLSFSSWIVSDQQMLFLSRAGAFQGKDPSSCHWRPVSSR